MTREEKQDLAQDALRYLVQLLPPEKYSESSECEIIYRALRIMASEDVGLSDNAEKRALLISFKSWEMDYDITNLLPYQLADLYLYEMA